MPGSNLQLRKSFRERATRCVAGGFSLIEMIIAIAILAILSAVAVPVVYKSIDAERHQATYKEMDAIVAAILGNPAEGNYGYLGDMGGLPASLTDLNTNPGSTTHSAGTNGVPMGWNGPYLNMGTDPTDYLYDAWRIQYSYNNVTGRISSGGLNGILGDSDDIVLPSNAVITSGSIAVTVTTNSIQNPGNIETLDDATADVWVSFSNNGTENAVQATYNGLLSCFTAGPGIHKGLHAITVTGANGPSPSPNDDFLGRSGAANVVVSQGVASVTVYIN